MVTATKDINGHTITATSPTIYSRVFRSVVYRNLINALNAVDLAGLPPVLSQLATQYITLMPVIVPSADNPSWVATESMTSEETGNAFHEWTRLPESDYEGLDELYSLVTTSANDQYLTPEGKPENPTK